MYDDESTNFVNSGESFEERNEAVTTSPIKSEKDYFPRATIETYQTGKIELPLYGVTVELPEGCYFRYDGEVASLIDHTRSVLSEFGLSGDALSEPELKSLANTTGHARFVNIKGGDSARDIRFAIGYILTKNEKRGDEFQIFNAAHEQAHMISSLDHESFLSFCNQVAMMTGRDIDLSELNDEMVCTILGLLAMEINGLPSTLFNGHEAFRIAHDVLESRSNWL